MFFPCFVFTIAGHDLLERLVRNKVGFSYRLPRCPRRCQLWLSC
jgi:hypothetical protein